MLLFPLLAALMAAGDNDFDLRIRPGTRPGRVQVQAVLPKRLLAGLPRGKLTQEQGAPRLRLALVHAKTGREGDPILGTYERREGALLFKPRYRLTAGQRYRATLVLVGNRTLTRDYRVPRLRPGPRAEVEKIYPSASVLPANLLKFYIYFSRPMQESEAVFDRIQLLDADGKPVPDPWRRTELWSADAKRLTLWVHPGRVKQGVNLREDIGPVLVPGRRYTLHIGPTLCAADGQEIGKAFTKKFRTTAEKRTRPLPETWKLAPPAIGTTKPLVLRFPTPLDRALLDRFVQVMDLAGKPVPGRHEVGTEETSWSFHPRQPWKQSFYTLTVNGELEDLAGNTPLRLFDVDLTKPAPKRPKLTIRFLPAGKKASGQ